MSKFLFKMTTLSAVIVGLTLCTGNSAKAMNIVTNGGFEDPDIGTGTFGIFPDGVSGWTQTGGGMEIQDNVAGSPFEGNQFAELDGNSVSKISQTLTTVAGQQYKLSFAISPRAGVADNQWDVIWDGGILANLSASGVGNPDTVWTIYEYLVTATSDSTVLSFGNLNETSNALGAYLDDVQVHAVPEVPTPAAILPGLIGMGVAALRKNKDEKDNCTEV